MLIYHNITHTNYKRGNKFMNISKRINLLLTEYDKTQEDLAESLGCTQSYVSKKLKTNSWKVEELENIADMIGCELTIEFTPKRRRLFAKK